MDTSHMAAFGAGICVAGLCITVFAMVQQPAQPTDAQRSEAPEAAGWRVECLLVNGCNIFLVTGPNGERLIGLRHSALTLLPSLP